MKTQVISSIRPLAELRPETALPRRHHVRLLRRGRWVQRCFDDGTELVGTVVLARFGRWRFGTREVTLLESNGRPYVHLGRIPPAQQYLEVSVEEAAPLEIANRIAAFVRGTDPLHRRVELRRDDEAVRQIERLLLWRWRVWTWLQRVLN